MAERGVPWDYLDPIWDDWGDPACWTCYVTTQQAIDWLSMPAAERERLARAAEARAEIYRQNSRHHP